mgnify:FL=1
MRPKGDFIFHITNSDGVNGMVRVDSEIFEAHSPTTKVLYLHGKARDFLAGKPFTITAREWEEAS